MQRYPNHERAFNELCIEMKNISIDVFFSISQSPNLPINDNNYNNFMKEFKLLGKLIRRRIHREDTVLFVMYEESNEARDLG